MKKIFLLLAITIVFLSSCTKDEFPYQATNVTAYDYNLSDTLGTTVQFMYVSGEKIESDTPKTYLISGSCDIADMELISYTILNPDPNPSPCAPDSITRQKLYMSKCMVTKKGFVYGEYIKYH